MQWPTPDPITYGDKLTAAQLNATTSIPGAFVYTPGPDHVLPVGTHTLWVTFTPADPESDGSRLAATTIIVAKATPALSWPTPAEMACGAALDDAQLNASASIPGSFEYSPAAGEVLSPGTHTLSVTFTPQDSEDYATAHATVSLTVTRAIVDHHMADTRSDYLRHAAQRRATMRGGVGCREASNTPLAWEQCLRLESIISQPFSLRQILLATLHHRLPYR